MVIGQALGPYKIVAKLGEGGMGEVYRAVDTRLNLMVNGRNDFAFPLETSQRPLFRLLGPDPQHKRHAIFDGGHIPLLLHSMIKEILDWFDLYLGPVKG